MWHARACLAYFWEGTICFNLFTQMNEMSFPPLPHSRNFSFLLFEEVWEFLMMMSYMVRCFNDPRLRGTCEKERERHSPRERLQQRSLAVTATRQGAHGHHHSTGKKKEKKRNKLFCKLDSKSSQPPPRTKRKEKKKKRNEKLIFTWKHFLHLLF